jgi:hypothetical protein
MKTNALARISLAVSLALTSAALLSAADSFYAQTTATQSYSTYIGGIPITGLSFTVPAASKDFNAALVTLNMPNLTLSDPTTPGAALAATLQIIAPFSPTGVSTATATIGCDTCTSLRARQG